MWRFLCSRHDGHRTMDGAEGEDGRCIPDLRDYGFMKFVRA